MKIARHRAGGRDTHSFCTRAPSGCQVPDGSRITFGEFEALTREHCRVKLMPFKLPAAVVVVAVPSSIPSHERSPIVTES